MTPWVKNDGGRAAAGYRGTTGDCVVRAVAIATGLPYQEVYDRVNALARGERRGKRKRGKSNARTGVYKPTIRRLMEQLGWQWQPTMAIGSGCKVHLRPEELPKGRLVVSLSRHLVAVVDGVVHDTHDPSRAGTRCVYGYWTAPATAPRYTVLNPATGKAVRVTVPGPDRPAPRPARARDERGRFLPCCPEWGTGSGEHTMECPRARSAR